MEKESQPVGRWKREDLMLFIRLVRSDLMRTATIDSNMRPHACKLLGKTVEHATFDKEYFGYIVCVFAVDDKENKLDVIRNINYSLELLHKEKVLHDPMISPSQCVASIF